MKPIRSHSGGRPIAATYAERLLELYEGSPAEPHIMVRELARSYLDGLRYIDDADERIRSLELELEAARRG